MNGDMYTFEVTGSGVFPCRLLSEQFCFPKSNDDAANAFENAGSHRRINLQSSRIPNAKLWRSYGWSIVGVINHCMAKEDYNLYHTWPC
tara:strand:+ start:352 stop:618 length:267 start_codon:yes stop_codon:yes gene_type:complete